MTTTCGTWSACEKRTPQLAQRLSALGAEAMARVLRNVEAGTAAETQQDHARATIAPKIEKSEGAVTFEEPAQRIYDRFRAFDPWPGIYVVAGGETIKLTDVAPEAASGRARTVLAIDDEVSAIVAKLKKRGFTSPYLRPFVVARINPIRFSKSTEFDFDDVLDRMKKNALKFNVDRVRQDQIVRAGGGPIEEDE